MQTSEKMYKVDDKISCAVAGIRADANILINRARLIAQVGMLSTQGSSIVRGGWHLTARHMVVQRRAHMSQFDMKYGHKYAWFPFDSPKFEATLSIQFAKLSDFDESNGN